MNAYCTICGTTNPPNAKYCCTCGQPVYAAPAPPVRRMGGGVALLFLIAGLFASACVGVGAMQYARRNRTVALHAPRLDRTFDLAPAKADALYDLLKPSDVRVIVGRRDGGVYVRGTRAEVDALGHLVELLVRESCPCQHTCEQRMDDLRPTWNRTKRYKLGRSESRNLFNLLAFEDVPVLVSRSGSKVTVRATGEDQDTIRQVVDILRGKPLRTY